MPLDYDPESRSDFMQGIDYWQYRKAFIKTTNQDLADTHLYRMLRCVSLTWPDLDDVRKQRWPGESRISSEWQIVMIGWVAMAIPAIILAVISLACGWI